MKKKAVAFLVAAAALGLVGMTAADASASGCQTESSTFYTKLYCGLHDRGFGQGTTIVGQQSIEAELDGAGAYSVEAVGVNSSGQLINSCAAYDTVADGNPSYQVGGPCVNAVKFWLEIDYY
jgi:hypothetical protein